MLWYDIMWYNVWCMVWYMIWYDMKQYCSTVSPNTAGIVEISANAEVHSAICYDVIWYITSDMW